MFWFVFIWFICFIIGITLFIILFYCFINDLKRKREKKKRMMKVNCIYKTTGTIIHIDHHTMTVEWTINGRKYYIYEKMDSHRQIGQDVIVRYNPHNPRNAYIQ